VTNTDTEPDAERRAMEDARRMSDGIRALARTNVVKPHRPPLANPIPAPDGTPAIPTRQGGARAVRCPFCKAAPGLGCQTVTGRPMTALHPSRLDAARPTPDPPDRP